MVVFWKKNADPATPLTLCDSPGKTVESFRFLASIITQDLKWELNISTIIKKTQQRMYFVYVLTMCLKLRLPPCLTLVLECF